MGMGHLLGDTVAMSGEEVLLASIHVKSCGATEPVNTNETTCC